MDNLRSAEVAITDGHDGHVPVVPPAPVWPAPTSAAQVAVGMGLSDLDYDKLAAAIVKAQAKAAAAPVADSPADANPGDASA